MKSPSTIFLIIAVVVVGAGAAYFFLGRNADSPVPASGLVSTNTGAAAGVSGTPAPSGISTGSQVVELLRNLSVIQLSPAVFQNPSFALLSDIGVAIPPVSSPGRRNPFAAVGADNPSAESVQAVQASPSETLTPATKVDAKSSGGPSF